METFGVPLAVVTLGLARVLPIVWLVPALGGHRMPALGRIVAALCLAVPTFPHLVRGTHHAGDPVSWMLLLGKETLVGLSMGLVAAAVFRAAEAAGWVADHLSGFSGSEFAEGSDAGQSPLAELGLWVAILAFLELGGPGLLAAAIARSYEAFPVGSVVSASSIAGVAQVVLLSSSRLLEAAVALSAPVLVASVVSNVVLGVLTRFTPAGVATSTSVSGPARALLGIGLALGALGAVDAALTASFPWWMTLVDRAAGAFR